jgi:hypothetical protein
MITPVAIMMCHKGLQLQCVQNKNQRIRVVSEYMRKRDDEHAIQKRT